MYDYLLLSLVIALPDKWVIAIVLNDEFGLFNQIFDVASVLDDDFFHLLKSSFVKFFKAFASNCKGAAHKNVFSYGHLSSLVLFGVHCSIELGIDWHILNLWLPLLLHERVLEPIDCDHLNVKE